MILGVLGHRPVDLLKEQKVRAFSPCLLKSWSWSNPLNCQHWEGLCSGLLWGYLLFSGVKEEVPSLKPHIVVTCSYNCTASQTPLAWLIDGGRYQTHQGYSDYHLLESTTENNEWLSVSESGFACNI